MGCRMCMNGCWIGIYYFIFQAVRVRCYDQYLAGHPDQTACHLATPGLMFIMNEEDVRVSVQDDLLEDGDKAWVGYVMEPVNLQYIGCVHVDDLDDGIHYDETPANADLGECYRICYNMEKPVLGIQGNGRSPCKCFGNEIKELEVTNTGCSTTCRNDQFICGGYSRIALYEPVGEVNASVLSSSDNDKCLSVHNTRYNWEYCGTYYRPACITDKDGQKTKVGARSKPWASSVSQCFDRGWYPIRYSGKGWSAKKIYWTGIVQTRYVMQLWEWPPTPNDLMYGYAERDGSRYVLKFTFDRNALNQSICHGEPSETRTTILTSEPEIVSQTVVQNKNSPGHFLGDNNSLFTNNPMSTTNDKNTARKVEVAVYMSVPLVVLVCLWVW